MTVQEAKMMMTMTKKVGMLKLGKEARRSLRRKRSLRKRRVAMRMRDRSGFP